MAITSPQKNRYAVATFLFLFLLLLSIFLFSKRALEPTLSLYRDLFLESPVPSSLRVTPPRPNSHHSSPETNPFVSDSGAVPESIKASLQKPLSPVSKTEFAVDSEDTSSEIGSVVSEVGGRNYSVRANASLGTTVDNGGKSGVDLSLERLKWAKHCDLYMGTWVKDEEYPIYKPGSCPYVDEAYDCQNNGRRDSEYPKWRWKPDGCDLPRRPLGTSQSKTM